MKFRRFILFICAVSLVGCGKQTNSTVTKIINDINSIGEVTVEDKELIESIDNACSSLSSSEKKKITNYEDFLMAKGELNALLKLDGNTAAQNDIPASEEDAPIEAEEYDIPELVGMNLDEAKKILDGYGMKINIQEEFDDNIPENCIISYPHSKYSKDNNNIDLTVSQGKGVAISITNNYTVDEIINQLQKDGLKPVIEYTVGDIGRYNLSDPADYIINANYKNMVKENSEVTIYAAKPPLKCLDAKFKINSEDGCEVSFELQNLSDKQIAGISFDFYFYDTMGNPVECSVQNSNHVVSKADGPFEPGEVKGYDFGAIFYNQSIGAIYPKMITIEYTDKTLQKITNTMYWTSNDYNGDKLHD